MAHPRRESKRLTTLIVIVALLAVGCGGTATVTGTDLPATDSTQTETGQPDVDRPDADDEPPISQVEPTAPPAPTDVPVEPTALPEPTEVPVEPTVEPANDDALAADGWSDDLQVGSCFNDGGTGPVVPVDCNEEHENELFLLAEFPAEPDDPFPADDSFIDEVFETICNDATLQWAGAPWGELPFRTAVWAPSQAQWEGGDRTVGCAAQSGLEDRPNKIGTAVGGDLSSPDGVVGRSSVGGQSDFYFSFQASTLYPLTAGEFDLPAGSPQVSPTGFQFGSREQGTESGAQAWTYLFDEMQASQLDTGLPDSWEVAGVHFVLDIPAFLFAARENDSDDWEIYITATSTGAVALTDNDVDDEFPSLSPDEDLILWSSGRNIWSMDLDGGNKTQLTDGPSDAFETQMSPDGSTILFTSGNSGNEDVWSMNADGSNQVNLTNHPAGDSWPFFSEDGSIIYFQTDRIGVNAILMMMEPDGSNQSYFSFEYLTNAALLPASITERFRDELTPVGEQRPPIEEDTDIPDDGEISVVPGSPDELNEIEHSQGRIRTSVPGGWEFRERGASGALSLVAAPSLADFDQRWDTLGVTFTVVDVDTAAGLVDLADLAPAAADSTCIEDSDSTQVDGALTTTTRRYSCGDEGQVVVVAIFDADDFTGLVFEGQWADDADGEASAELIEQISDASRWG